MRTPEQQFLIDRLNSELWNKYLSFPEMAGSPSAEQDEQRKLKAQGFAEALQIVKHFYKKDEV